jgi:hypothetical protein
VLYFRLSVPLRFRSILKVSELTTSLRTQDRKNAIPAAHKLAGEAKTLFLFLDAAMTDKNDYDNLDDDFIRGALDGIGKEEPEAFKKKSPVFSLPAMMAMKKKDIELDTLKERHERELEQALNKKELDVLRRFQAVVVNAPATQQEPIEENKPPTKKRSKSPRLSVVRENLLDNLDEAKAEANKKTRAAKWWDVFIELTGNKQANDLEQIDIDCYLEEVCFLPSEDTAPEYKDLSYKEKIKLCKKNKSETISKKAFVRQLAINTPQLTPL